MPKSRPRSTYRYSDHIKATAVLLSQLPAVAVRDVAESRYIHPFMLSRWRKQARKRNTRPRETLRFNTLAEELAKVLQ